MSFLLDTMESVLKLSAADKATVDAALPTLHNWAHLLNQQWDTLLDAVTWLSSGNGRVVTRLLTNGKALGPIAEEVLGGGGSVFEAGTAYSAINDAKWVITNNPKTVAALTADYNKLAPLVAQIQSDLAKPEVQVLVNLVQAKMAEHGVSAHALASAALGAKPKSS